MISSLLSLGHWVNKRQMSQGVVGAFGIFLFVSHPRLTAEDVGNPEHLVDRINFNKFNVIKVLL